MVVGWRYCVQVVREFLESRGRLVAEHSQAMIANIKEQERFNWGHTDVISRCSGCMSALISDLMACSSDSVLTGI